MDLANPAANGMDYGRISDEDLIRHYCENQEEVGLKDFLLKRFGPTIRRACHRNAKVRPTGTDHDSFFRACYNRAQFNFLNRVCGFRFEGSLDGWIGALVRTTALDERRTITRPPRGHNAPPEEGEQDQTHKALELTEDEIAKLPDLERQLWRAAGFRPEPRVFDLLAADDKKRIVSELLLIHAAESDEGLDSSKEIRLRYWDGWTFKQLAVYVYGEPLTKQEDQNNQKAVARKIEKDFELLQVLAKKRYGITSRKEI